MSERKTLRKRLRFEVFKRDKFTCQYCGKSAPDVILEVDHIQPVSKGGNNDLLNLVTSCRDCNRGKGNIELSDDTTVKIQQKKIEEMADRREQIEMMMEWRKSLRNIDTYCVDMIDSIFKERTEWGVNESGKRDIARWIDEFSFQEVMAAADIAIDYYYEDTNETWHLAFCKIPGICYRKRQNHDDRNYFANYLVKAASNNFCYCDEYKIIEYVRNYIHTNDDFERSKDCVRKARSWSTFNQNLWAEFGAGL